MGIRQYSCHFIANIFNSCGHNCMFSSHRFQHGVNYHSMVCQSVGEGEAAGDKNYACCGCSKPLIMITAAASLIVFRIWDTYLDFKLVPSVSERESFHCQLANPIIVAFAVS